MKTDLYTKTVLTVIAISLAVHVFKDTEIIPSAYAAEKASDIEYRLVPISNMNTLDVRIVDINTYDELNVNLRGVETSDELKVNIMSIDTSDELDVNLDEIGGGWVSHGGPIRVKVE